MPYAGVVERTECFVRFMGNMQQQNLISQPSHLKDWNFRVHIYLSLYFRRGWRSKVRVLDHVLSFVVAQCRVGLVDLIQQITATTITTLTGLSISTTDRRRVAKVVFDVAVSRGGRGQGAKEDSGTISGADW